MHLQSANDETRGNEGKVMLLPLFHEEVENGESLMDQTVRNHNYKRVEWRAEIFLETERQPTLLGVCPAKNIHEFFGL